MENKAGMQYAWIRQLLTVLRQALVLSLCSVCIILLTSQITTHEPLSGMYLGQELPGTSPERFARGIIPDDLHSVPVFSADGKTVYYKSMDGESIMVASEKGNKWSFPTPLFIRDEVKNSDDPCLSPSGDQLFFSSYNKEANRDYIYCCELGKDGLSAPEQPPGHVNQLDLHWQFCLAGNGNIYFASNGNIYCSEMQSGQYLDPYKLGEAVNTELSECTPYVSPDESMLIFARSINGKPDLFLSRKDSNGHWLSAKPLNAGINTEHHEMCPRMTDDGKYFFFISSREGLFSAYWVDASVLDLQK